MKSITTLLFVLLSFVGFSQSFEPIEIEIPSVTINETKLLRKSNLIEMRYNQKFKFLLLSFEIIYYSDSVGYYGSKIDLKGVNNYVKDIIADNKTFVNPETGEIVPPTTFGAIGQYDFFYLISQNKSVNVHELIRQYAEAVKEW